ncbi:MAG: SCP2 sterol-binding domain-containing protein [Actinobacteria bacterium]|nr:SCP2 sterol-binding domain-containing protein [Actinomycetota bacterium]
MPMGVTSKNKLSNILRFLPQGIHNIIMKILLFILIRRNPQVSLRLKDINGKIFLLEAVDINKKYFLKIDNSMIKVLSKGVENPDVLIKGSFSTFAGFLLNRIDPDEAFFNRDLQIESGLEFALYLKNVLGNLRG